MDNTAALQEALGIAFQDPSLLEQALVHTSYVNENPGRAPGHNERLEFLGDSVLGLVVAEKLYRDFPGLSEGEMTRFRAVVVRRESLAAAALTLRLDEFLYLGRGEEASGGRKKLTNLACALEAVIASVYLDRGMAAAAALILRLLGEELAKAVSHGAGADYKSRLQELIQSRHQTPPLYRLVAEAGPDHDKTFTVEAVSGDRVLGRGTGKSKKSAEMEAARSALESLAATFTD